MATRAASIWRAVIQPGSSACRPKVPKDTSSPPLALPRVRPFCCLRNLLLLGANMTRNLLRLSLGLRRPGLPCRRGARRHDLAVEDPALHADGAVRGARRGEAVLDVGAQGVQR